MWEYNYTPSSDELYHHGIKGQKWGKRRFQNQDGSLTPAGRERYDDDSDSASSAKKTKEKDKWSTKKKVAVAGAAVVGTTLAAFGTYKLHKAIDNNAWNKAVDIGREKVKEMNDRAGIGKIVIKDRSGFEMDTTALRVRKEADRAYAAMRYSDKIKYFVNNLKRG